MRSGWACAGQAAIVAPDAEIQPVAILRVLEQDKVFIAFGCRLPAFHADGRKLLDVDIEQFGFWLAKGIKGEAKLEIDDVAAGVKDGIVIDIEGLWN